MRFRAGLPLRAKGCATSTTEQRPSVDSRRVRSNSSFFFGEKSRARSEEIGATEVVRVSTLGKRSGRESEISARTSISARKARPLVPSYRFEGSRQQARPKSIIRSVVVGKNNE